MRALALVLVALGGCVHLPPTPVSVSLATAGIVAGVLADDAERSGDTAGCIAGRTTAEALSVASRFVGSTKSIVPFLPGITLDASGCSPPLRLVGIDEPRLVALVVDVSLAGLEVLAIQSLLPEQDVEWLRLAIQYVRGAVPPILDELISPDGVVVVPGVP